MGTINPRTLELLARQAAGVHVSAVDKYMSSERTGPQESTARS